MLKKSEFIIRLASFFLLFCIPGLYLRQILPLFFLPCASVLTIFLAARLEKTRIRTPFILLLSALLLSVLYGLFLLLCTVLKVSFLNRIFLYFGVSFTIILITVLVSVLFTFLWLRSGKWKVIEPLIMILILAALFWSQNNFSLTLFNHPVYASLFLFVFILIQIVLLLLASGNRKSLISALLFLPLLFFSVFFILRTYNTLSISNNGGLLQPTLFQFDFSPYLTLQPEIKQTDSLVLIVKTAQENTYSFLRRLYLSGWSEKKGFYELQAPGEFAPLKKVPRLPEKIPYTEFSLRYPAEQEYFIVNFDPSSFIAMDYPVEVVPYKLWNSSAFNGAYSVTSHTIGFMPFELSDSAIPSGKEEEGMTAEDIELYTLIDDQTRTLVQPIAESVTSDIHGYYDKILALLFYLRDGDFRYSLKPGIAPDGNQLKYFLTGPKKGYCTYFAFSMCLMLRSLGIPSRVAAGFFVQPDSGTLDYYPVRANMAHAWVEVFFPRYGWISFDPTTQQVAEGEDILFDMNPGGDEFISLLNEIIANRGRLTINDEDFQQEQEPGISQFLSGLWRTAKKPFAVIGGVLLLCLCLWLLFRDRLAIYFSRNPRKIILCISKTVYAKLKRRAKPEQAAVSKKALVQTAGDDDISELFRLEQKAKFAPDVSMQDAEEAKQLFRKIKNRYRNTKTKSGILFLCIFLGASFYVCPQDYDDITQEPAAAPEAGSPEYYLEESRIAAGAENWDRALSFLTEAGKKYPENPAIPFSLGGIYYQQNLYLLAYTEFQNAEKLGYTDPEIFSLLSETAGYLNRDEDAYYYINKYLEIYPHDLYSWSNYGWLCYKTNRIDEGIQALHRTIDLYGPDGNLYMGLGNLYTAAFNYPEAKKYYSLAIHIATERYQKYLLAIYYYNRSILEEIFYNFEDAYQDTINSLEAMPRSSGYLMQGELEMRKLAFPNAVAQYLKAYNIDSSPLATMALAETLIQAGYINEAAEYLSAAEKRKDLAWLANYGTTMEQYNADLHKMKRSLYSLRLNLEKRKTCKSLSSAFTRLWNITKYTVMKWYHDANVRIISKNVARYYETSEKKHNVITEQGIMINVFYYSAFDKWWSIAAPYLNRAQTIETAHIPAAEPVYYYEQGKQKKDTGLLDTAIRTLDPEWEKNYIARALAERIKITGKKQRPALGEYYRNLYLLHPAAFIIYDLDLPVSIETEQSSRFRKEEKQLVNLLRSSGFTGNAQTGLSLSIEIHEDTIRLSLIDSIQNKTIHEDRLLRPAGSKADLSGFVNRFTAAVFRSPLGL
ncbi:hypothetical protein K7I13_08465 [Brucepastera parasyntrophica]|uniref:transglutaminase domain-containing protein n=1 Tax=Brucepastera parasyntrophica TaxID=2880008 RepID=UPI00210A4281|nr:transglutaminase domain-containing protein [Brucepastera parasyntrophica]ULQ58599.1 hypothetical protein K7I13_08465 [Brucepastera parasyntrophica]